MGRQVGDIVVQQQDLAGGGSSMPVIRLNVVVLPEPLGPISATIEWLSTTISSSLTAMIPP